MAAPTDFTDLATVKSYFAPSLVGSTVSDSVLSLIISATSNWVQKYVSRQLIASTYVEQRNGNGRTTMRTKNWPIIAVSSLTIDSMPVTVASGNIGAGFLTDDKYIYLRPGVCSGGAGGMWAPAYFSRGVQNVTASYTAGFITPGQVAVSLLPSWTGHIAYSFGQQILPGNGYYYSVQVAGVSGASAPTFPTAPGATVTDGTVTWLCDGAFVAPPTGANYLPLDIVNATLEQVDFNFILPSRIGDVSTGEGAQRVNFMIKGAHPATLDKLNPHRAVVPIGD